MFLGREKELLRLNQYHRKNGIRILVLYGQKGIGKTALIQQFLKDKEYVYYKAISSSFRQQKQFFAEQLKDIGILVSDSSTFTEMFEEMEACGRKIFVIDDIQNMGKTENDFWQEIQAYSGREDKDMLLIFCTSSVGWVENTLKTKLEELLIPVDEFLKLKELKYKEFKECFPGFSGEDSIGAYSILGGIPGLWKCFSDEYDLRENIEKNMLQEEALLLQYGRQYVEEELRETAVYNTILVNLAGGKQKLNDLHLNTNFSRAKISVYLKNLMQLDLVDKVHSIVTEGYENTQKGLYEISLPYLDFYYRYLFPNQNRIGVWDSRKLYEEKIAETLPKVINNGFKKVCLEFLEQESEKGRLPEKFTYLGKWVGKPGTIDFIFQNEDGEFLIGICNWGEPVMRYDEYSLLVKCQESAGIKSEYVTLFSGGKFDNRLKEEHKKNPYVALVSWEQMG